MKLKPVRLLAVYLLCGAFAAAQDQVGLLDVYSVKVKPEKRTEFNNLIKKMVDANHKNKGDEWIAYETVYGNQGTVSFVSPRKNYAEIDAATGAFMAAMNKALGAPAAAKMFADLDACSLGSSAEIRRRRWDLSVNPPANEEEQLKSVGGWRWLRVTTVHLKPGKSPQYVDNIKMVAEAVRKDGGSFPVWISQAVTGPPTFYITMFGKSLADFDAQEKLSLSKILGDERYKEYMRISAECIDSIRTEINRFVPELSNPAEGIVSVAPDFWRPKPAPAAKPKPKTS